MNKQHNAYLLLEHVFKVTEQVNGNVKKKEEENTGKEYIEYGFEYIAV